MRRPRHLSPEDRAVWDQVAKRIEPMHPTQPLPEALPDPTPVKPAKKPPLFKVGEKAQALPAGPMLNKAPPQMDAKAFGKMTKGKLKPEARIDLHGMTLDEAHPELLAFVLGSQAVGKRLVLVITGKGKQKDPHGPKGVLRHYVPQWLRLSPLKQAVMEVRPAHLRHGGDGAFYVYLRRTR